MSKKRDIFWFKEVIAPKLEGYKIEYRYFEDGDFGSLNQATFDSDEIAGEIDFWEWGWLGIHLWDCVEDNWLLNVLLKPEEQIKQKEAIKKMSKLLNLTDLFG